jgi:hypothetical protein
MSFLKVSNLKLSGDDLNDLEYLFMEQIEAQDQYSKRFENLWNKIKAALEPDDDG